MSGSRSDDEAAEVSAADDGADRGPSLPGAADHGPAARLRDVFPWWYLAGAVVSFAVLAGLDTDGIGAAGAFWGAPMGMIIRERRQDAVTRRERGLPVDRAALTGPRWSEPLLAAVWVGVSIGLGFVLGAVIGDDPASQGWTGGAVLAASVVAFGVLALVARRRNRRRRS